MRSASFEDPRYFLNRHLSWLQFNRRVLEEAVDPANPLLERVKFLGITASNLDEFVEVRVAGLLQQAEKSRGEIEPDGMTPGELLPRNLYERVEVMFRLKDPELCGQISSKVLVPYLADTEKARILLPDGTYVRMRKARGAPSSRNGSRFSVQEFFMGLSANENGAERPHGLSRFPQLRSSSAFEILSKEWKLEQLT